MAAMASKAFGLDARRAGDIYDEVVAGMRRINEALDVREVTAKDRGTVLPLLAACPAASIVGGIRDDVASRVVVPSSSAA